MDPIYFAVIAGVLGLAAAASFAAYVLRQDEGSERMREISAAIKEGAMAFLKREYQILAVFIVILGQQSNKHMRRRGHPLIVLEIRRFKCLDSQIL